MSKLSTTESIITSDGELKVYLEAGEVTWFDFLWFSRGTASTDGGWNSKSHWRKLGVQQLIGTAAESLELWTKNSLKMTGLPRPRTDSFMLNREDSERRRKLERSFAEKRIEDASENELSYALWNGGRGKLMPLADTRLLGYEMPLAEDSEGQLKVDLFGISSGGDAIEIIELKREKNHTDSPLIAFTEAICYALQTLRCKESLRGELNKNPELKVCEKAFSRINLTILAPIKYWCYWGHPLDAELDGGEINEKLQIILERVNEGIASKPAEGPQSRLTLALKELEFIQAK